MAEAKIGDKVQVNYTAKLEDGSVFFSSEGKNPVELQLGSGTLIPDIENSIVGMNLGDKKTVHLSAENSYGPYRKELVVETPREKLPPNFTPKLGGSWPVDMGAGGKRVGRITHITEETITFDTNHPLAGHDLTFDIELVKIL